MSRLLRMTGRLAGAATGGAAVVLLCSVPGWASQAAGAAGSGGTVTINGPSVALHVTTPGKTAKRTFTGKAGLSVSTALTQWNTTDGCGTLSLVEPGGATLDSHGGCGLNGSNVGLGPDTLPVSGTYTIELMVNSTATGGGTLWLSAPVTIGAVTVNGPHVPLTSTRYGQDVARTFKGTAGESVSEVLSGVNTTDGCAGLRLIEPGGATLDSGGGCGVNGSAVGVGPDTLPVSGTYKLMVTINPTAMGGGTLWLSAPITIGTITVNGQHEPLKTTRYGQDVARTFSGTAGESVSEVLSQINTTDGCAGLRLIEPGGATLDSGGGCGVNGSAVGIGPDTLPVSGTYQIMLTTVSPTATGGGTLWLSAPVTIGTITVNGPQQPLKVTRYGQAVARTFSGTAGESVSEVLSQINTTDGCAGLSLIEPSGATLDSAGGCGVNGSSITVGPDNLPATGTYSVRLSLLSPTFTGGGQLKVST